VFRKPKVFWRGKRVGREAMVVKLPFGMAVVVIHSLKDGVALAVLKHGWLAMTHQVERLKANGYSKVR
jgi:hypothetical protein